MNETKMCLENSNISLSIEYSRADRKQLRSSACQCYRRKWKENEITQRTTIFEFGSIIWNFTDFFCWVYLHYISLRLHEKKLQTPIDQLTTKNTIKKETVFIYLLIRKNTNENKNHQEACVLIEWNKLILNLKNMNMVWKYVENWWLYYRLKSKCGLNLNLFHQLKIYSPFSMDISLKIKQEKFKIFIRKIWIHSNTIVKYCIVHLPFILVTVERLSVRFCVPTYCNWFPIRKSKTKSILLLFYLTMKKWCIERKR